MVRSVRLSVEAHDLATVVEADGGGSGQGSRGGVRVIDGGEDAVVQQKTVLCSVGIDVLAQDLATVVDARGRSFCDGIGVIDGREDALVQQKSVARERGRVAAVAGRAHHPSSASPAGAIASPGRVPGILPPRRPRTGHRERREHSQRRSPPSRDDGCWCGLAKAMLTSLSDRAKPTPRLSSLRAGRPDGCAKCVAGSDFRLSGVHTFTDQPSVAWLCGRARR